MSEALNNNMFWDGFLVGAVFSFALAWITDFHV